MLSKTDISFIRGLHRTSERRLHRLFIAEGNKLVRDMMGYFGCCMLIAREREYEALKEHLLIIPKQYHPQRTEILSDNFDFERISALRTPQGMLALFELPIYTEENLHNYPDLMILLDDVQDPGNMGTIIRTANWFGVRKLLLTEGCADAFSPKVVQATMGALAQVATIRLSAEATSFLSRYEGRVYGTYLDGANLYTQGIDHHKLEAGLLVMGNEGKGISPTIEPYITERLYIPPYEAKENTASESLNVAIATAICLSELRYPRTLLR